MPNLVLLVLAAAPVPHALRAPSVVNVLANPGFEAGFKDPFQKALPIAPWTTGGKIQYLVDEGGNSVVKEADQSGHVFTLKVHTGKVAFTMNTDLSSDVPQGKGNMARTFLRQELKVPVAGKRIVQADAWVSIMNTNAVNDLDLKVEYTFGPPTTAVKTLIQWSALPTELKWVRWDFHDAIDRRRVVKAIEFSESIPYYLLPARYHQANPSLIDDVTLGVLKG